MSDLYGLDNEMNIEASNTGFEEGTGKAKAEALSLLAGKRQRLQAEADHGHDREAGKQIPHQYADPCF